MPEHAAAEPLAIDQTFLSPRVVDQRAFEEFSATLKDLMRDAAGQGTTMRATTGEIRQLDERLRGATRELQQKIETAVRLIPTLDQRTQRSEVIADKVGVDLVERERRVRELVNQEIVVDRARVAEQARGIVGDEVRAALEGARNEFEAQTRAVVGEAVRGMEERVADLGAARAEWDGAIEDARARIRECVDEHLTMLAGELAEAHRRTELAVLEAEPKTTAKIEAAEGRLSAIVERADGRLREILSSVPERLEGIESRVDAVATDVERRLVRFRRAAEEIIDTAAKAKPEEIARQVREATLAARVVVAERERVIGEQLEAALTRGEKLLAGVQAAVAQLEQTRGQADLARRLLGQAILDSASEIDAMEARVEKAKRSEPHTDAA